MSGETQTADQQRSDTNEPNESAGWRLLVGVLANRWGTWVTLGVTAAIAAGLSVAIPAIVRVIVDEATAGTTPQRITWWALVVLACAIGNRIITVAVSWLATNAAWDTTNEMRLQLTDRVLRLDHNFHRTHSPGQLVQRIDGDVDNVAEFLELVLPGLLASLLTIVGVLAVLFTVNWQLGLGLLAFVVATGAILVWRRNAAISEAQDTMQSQSVVYGGVEERLVAARELRRAGALDYALWRHAVESGDALVNQTAQTRAMLSVFKVFQTAMAVGVALALAIGAGLVQQNMLEVGTALMLVQYFMLVQNPLNMLIEQMELVQKASGAVGRVQQMLAVTSAIADGGDTPLPPGALSVEFDAVDFTYDDPSNTDPTLVLTNVTAHIDAGRRVGLVGRTGSGKTTVSRLLLRLADATDGTVRLGGVPITDTPMSSVRARTALVPQEVHTFNDTVRNNVTLFNHAISDDTVEHALEQVGLGHLGSRMHEPLGADGVGLSDGEAQLLSLARMWVRQPDLVVFDEATARVDPETEQRIAAAVDRVTTGRTTIVIAHRLSTLDTMDDIIMLDHGRIVEHGRRIDLLADPTSRFAALRHLAGDRDSIDEINSISKTPQMKGGADGTNR